MPHQRSGSNWVSAMTPPKDQAPGLVARLARYGKPSLEPSIIADYSEELAQQAHDRIKQLEAENAELRGKLEKAEKTLTTAMKLAAMDLREQANIRSPVQSLVRDQYNPEDDK